jgi:hypothetical protein
VILVAARPAGRAGGHPARRRSPIAWGQTAAPWPTRRPRRRLAARLNDELAAARPAIPRTGPGGRWSGPPIRPAARRPAAGGPVAIPTSTSSGAAASDR